MILVKRRPQQNDVIRRYTEQVILLILFYPQKLTTG